MSKAQALSSFVIWLTLHLHDCAPRASQSLSSARARTHTPDIIFLGCLPMPAWEKAGAEVDCAAPPQEVVCRWNEGVGGREAPIDPGLYKLGVGMRLRGG